MMHPALYSYRYAITIALVSIFLGLLYAVIIHPLVPSIPLLWLQIDGVLFLLMYAALSIPLWMIAQFVNAGSGYTLQRMVNHVAMAMATMVLWLGIQLLLLYALVPADLFMNFVILLPLKSVLALLLYIVLFQTIVLRIKNDDEPCVEVQDEQDEQKSQDIREYIERISVKSGAKIHVVSVDEVQYIQAEGDYVMIHTAHAKFLKEQTMKYFELHLPMDTFVRIHRSTIVNIHAISNVQLYEKQNYMVVLKHGATLKVSAAGYKQLKHVLQL